MQFTSMKGLVTRRLPALQIDSRLADAAVGFGGGVLGGYAGRARLSPQST